MLSCVCDSGLSKCEVVDTKYYTRRVPRTVYETKYTAVRTLALLSAQQRQLLQLLQPAANPH